MTAVLIWPKSLLLQNNTTADCWLNECFQTGDGFLTFITFYKDILRSDTEIKDEEVDIVQ